jgi:hypothetical protein
LGAGQAARRRPSSLIAFGRSLFVARFENGKSHMSNGDAMDSPIQVALPEPTWIRQHLFTIKEVAEANDLHFETLNTWLRISHAMRHIIPKKLRHKRLLTGHHAYVIGILAAVSHAGVRVSEGLIRSAFEITHHDGRSILPHIGETVEFAERRADGKPTAILAVDMSAVWLDLEPKLQALMMQAQR